jgi:hypothetical protein
MEYQGFVVDAFERDPGTWRAKILRSGGKPVVTGRKKNWRFVTGVDATTALAALLIALEAIDARAFSRAPPLPDKFWRRHGRRANGTGNRARSEFAVKGRTGLRTAKF